MYPRDEQPLVTVILPTYNRPDRLGEALHSAVSQTYANLEILVVRDGGAEVRGVVESLADERIRLVDRPVNRGKPYSLNEAASLARGRYLCYLDDDDVYYPEHVQVLVEAIEGQERYGAVYSDLYEVHYRPTADGRRVVLAKNVEISRDFDRMVMLQFNQALHTSVLHRRDLLEKAGGYNESLNVLIDWDLTRRLCFYTDFLHVPVVTGEHRSPVGECDRISVQRRKNPSEYIRNLLTIRSSRPPKPWDCVEDLSIIVIAEGDGETLRQTLRDLWSHTFYPSRIYVPLEEGEARGFSAGIPNTTAVAVRAGASREERVDAALRQCEGELVAVVPAGLAVEPDEAAWVERSLQAVLDRPQGGIAVELVENTANRRGFVCRRGDLERARAQHGHLGLEDSLRQCGVEVRRPRREEFPLLLDCTLTAALEVQRGGRWREAATLYDNLAQRWGNELWMRTQQANALIWAGEGRQALDLLESVNGRRPTPATLLLEGRAWKQLRQYDRAVGPLCRAEAILAGDGGAAIRQDWKCNHRVGGRRRPPREM